MVGSEEYFLRYNKDNIFIDLIQAEQHFRYMKDDEDPSTGSANCIVKHLADAEGEANEAISHSTIAEPELATRFRDLRDELRALRTKMQTSGISAEEGIIEIRRVRRLFEGFNPDYDISKCETCGPKAKEYLQELRAHRNLPESEREYAQEVLTYLSEKHKVPTPKLTIVDSATCTDPNFGLHKCDVERRWGEIIVCKGGINAHVLSHEFKHYLDCLKGEKGLLKELDAEKFALKETEVTKTVKYQYHNKNIHEVKRMDDIMSLLAKWGPQHVAKGIERGLIEVDKMVTGWPVKPSLVGNLALTGVGAIGAFMTDAPWDEFLAIMGGHHSTTLWDYLEEMMGVPPAARVAAPVGYTYIAPTGQWVPTRPGLGATIRYAPEQRVITAPKFIPGVLRPKYQLGS